MLLLNCALGWVGFHCFGWTAAMMTCASHILAGPQANQST